MARPFGFWWAARGAAHQPDVYDVHFAFNAVISSLVGAGRHIPFIVHFQGPWADESALQGDGVASVRVKRVLERTVYRRAAGIVVLSEAFREVLLSGYAVSPSRVHVVAPGVDTQRFSDTDRYRARETRGFSPQESVAIAVRRLVPRMGLDVLLDAWSLLRPVPGGASLVIVGAGSGRSDLEKKAMSLGISSQVRFVGRVADADLAEWYRAADVSVVPSLALEGYGLVALEALASGTPVVASDVGGLREALLPLAEDLLVPPGDPVALASRLQAAFDEKLLPSRHECRRYAEQFAWSGVAQRHVELYRKVLSQERLRVVVIGHSARLSGGELAIAELISAMEDVDFHVILAEDGPLVPLLLRVGASVEVLPFAESTRGLSRDRVRAGRLPCRALVDTGRYIWLLRRAIRRHSADIVHTNTLKAALYGAAAARLSRLPCIWHIRDSITRGYLPASAVYLIRGAARVLPTELVANSSSTLASLHVPPGRGTVVPSPVRVATASPGRVSQKSGRLRVGILGRLSPWKGQDMFIRAFAMAFPDSRSADAVIIGEALFGEDEFVVDLRNLAQGLSISDRVEFRGFREDVEAELARLDILVHASTSPEPFGQVVVQGMAAGLAVIASDAGGPREIITEGVDGFLCPPGDVEGLAERLRTLAADADLRRRLGDAGRKRSLAFAPEQIAPLMRDVYRRAVAPSHALHSSSKPLD